MNADQGDGGRVVPTYALTRGRTRSIGTDVPLEALVSATENGTQGVHALQLERRAIVELCTEPLSVGELATRLQIPLGVARVLVSDLASGGYLAVHAPQGTAAGPDAHTLERLLDGPRAR
jgi:Protein of unknown function (DUF742)